VGTRSNPSLGLNEGVNAPDASLLFVAAAAGGAINSVAGGGSFLSFPALIYAGVPATVANATNTVALWPGSVASAGAYREELQAQKKTLLSLGIVSLAGGILGAELLLHTPERTFVKLIPFLMLGATLLFAFGNRLTAILKSATRNSKAPAWLGFLGITLLQLTIATYGGYFGGGIGILMLAMLALMGMENIHEMNALKTVLGSLINGVACWTFIANGVVRWPQAGVMVVGAILGGYFGAHFARKLNPAKVRQVVIGIGFIMTAVFLGKAFLR
jgi:uncharacterized membrane protein YfcA